MSNDIFANEDILTSIRNQAIKLDGLLLEANGQLQRSDYLLEKVLELLENPEHYESELYNEVRDYLNIRAGR